VRQFRRLGIQPDKDHPKAYNHDRWQSHIQSLLSTATAEEFRRWHAYIVEHGKRHCKKTGPSCDACPLSTICPRIGVAP
jgi:endonuclease III